MTGPEVTAAMKAEDVDAGLVARAEAAREAALREWHVEFRAGQQTEPGHVLGMRAALAAVLPEIQAQALEHLADLLSDDKPTNPALIGPIGLQDLANDLRAGTLTARLAETTEETAS